MTHRALNWRLAFVGVISLCILLVTALAVYHSWMEGRLLRADPDAISDDPALVRFAINEAQPAYATFCAKCHGALLQGNTALGAPRLNDADWLYGSGQTSEIERTIYYGIRSANPKDWNQADMPAYAQATPYPRYPAVQPLTPEEIRDVTEYVLSLSRPAIADKQRAARGIKVFAGHGGCPDCHGPDAKGNSAIGAPNLTDDVWLYGDGSRDSIWRSIARGHQGTCPAWFPALKPVTLRALALFIHQSVQAR